MKKIRTAVVGCGNVSRVHFDALEKIDFIEIAASCDVKKDRAEKRPGNTYTDFYEMLENEALDAIHVCTPHYLHADMAIAALQRGIAVLTEKPPAIKYADALDMIEASKKSGAPLGVCFQNRYNPQSVFLKRIVDEKKYGELKAVRAFVTWQRGAEYFDDDWHGTLEKEGGGVVINQAIHTLDLVGWLVGRDVESVRASVSTKKFAGIIETEDTADAIITYDGGVTCAFYATLCNGVNSPVMIDLVFENARVVLDDDVCVIKDGGREIISFEKELAAVSYWGSSHRRLIADFYDCLQSGRQFPLSGEEGLKAVETMNLIYKSGRGEK